MWKCRGSGSEECDGQLTSECGGLEKESSAAEVQHLWKKQKQPEKKFWLSASVRPGVEKSNVRWKVVDSRRSEWLAW